MAVLEEQHLLRDQHLGTQVLDTCKPVAWSQGEKEGLKKELFSLKIPRGEGDRCEQAVQPPEAELFQERSRKSLYENQIEIGVGLLEWTQEIRKQIGAKGGDDPEPETLAEWP